MVVGLNLNVYYLDRFYNLSRFGDVGRKISILKLDIEREELWSMPQFLESDVLKNVDQIHVEVTK